MSCKSMNYIDFVIKVAMSNNIKTVKCSQVENATTVLLYAVTSREVVSWVGKRSS